MCPGRRTYGKERRGEELPGQIQEREGTSEEEWENRFFIIRLEGLVFDKVHGL